MFIFQPIGNLDANPTIWKVNDGKIRCLGCPSFISKEMADLGDGYCPACQTILNIKSTVRDQKAYAPDTKLGACPQCASRNLTEIAERRKKAEAIPVLLGAGAIASLFFGSGTIVALPLTLMLVLWMILRNQISTLKGIYRECGYCHYRWEVVEVQPSFSPSQPTT